MFVSICAFFLHMFFHEPQGPKTPSRSNNYNKIAEPAEQAYSHFAWEGGKLEETKIFSLPSGTGFIGTWFPTRTTTRIVSTHPRDELGNILTRPCDERYAMNHLTIVNGFNPCEKYMYIYIYSSILDHFLKVQGKKKPRNN